MDTIAGEFIALVKDPLVNFAPFKLAFRQFDSFYAVLLGDRSLQSLEIARQSANLPFALLNPVGAPLQDEVLKLHFPNLVARVGNWLQRQFLRDFGRDRARIFKWRGCWIGETVDTKSRVYVGTLIELKRAAVGNVQQRSMFESLDPSESGF